MPRKLTFEAWIEQVGVIALAKRLKVNKVTVFHWLKGRSYPRVDQMRRIKKISEGLIGYEEIIDRPLRLSIRRVGRQ